MEEQPQPTEKPVQKKTMQEKPVKEKKGKEKEVKIKREYAKGDDAENPIVVDDDWDLIRPTETQPTAGIPNAEQYRSCVCVKNGVGRGKIGIFKYGPRNRPVYRREEIEPEDYKTTTDISEPAKRLGEQYERGEYSRKVWTVTRKNFVSVQGVAFPDGCNLRDLDPSRFGDRVPCPVDVLIKWKIQSKDKESWKEEKSWETRTVFRRVWGKQGDGPDTTLFRAAKRAEIRFNLWYNGLEKAKDQSPTPDPVLENDDSSGDSDDSDSSDSDDDKRRRKGKRKELTKRSRARSKRSKSDTDSDDSEDSDDDRTRKTKKKRKSRAKSKRSKDETDSDDSEDTDDDRTKKTKKKRKSKTRSKKSRDETDSDDSEDSDDDRAGKKKKNPKASRKELEKIWCFMKQKKRSKLSPKEKKRMDKAVREWLKS